MESILVQASNLAKTANEFERKKLIDGLRDIAISLEDTQESAQRLLYSQYPLMALRLGCDINLFNTLHDAGRPISVKELSEKTRVAPTLMGRLLRYMSSQRIIKETGPDSFTANNVTKTFTNPGFQGGVYHYFDYVQRGIQNLPDFLKERDYKDVESLHDTALMTAWGSTVPPFVHYPTKPELFRHFNRYMASQRAGMPTWLDVFPYREAAKGLPYERALFVDVGGGIGHQAVALREALPKVPNRIVLQDMPFTLEQALKHPGVEIMVQDFFKPQVVKGAKMYYMRNIIHDYPDEQAIMILKNIKDAFGPESVILIDDMYLDAQHVHWQATQLDVTMMACMSSIERTEEQWKSLISKAGLRIRKVYRYTESLCDSIIECVSVE